MAKRVISFQKSLAARGVLAMAQQQYNRVCKEYIPMLAEIVGEKTEDDKSEYPYFGIVSDAVYSDYSFDTMLKKLEITVRPQSKRGR